MEEYTWMDVHCIFILSLSGAALPKHLFTRQVLVINFPTNSYFYLDYTPWFYYDGVPNESEPKMDIPGGHHSHI